MLDPSMPGRGAEGEALRPIPQAIETGEGLSPPTGESALRRELRVLADRVAELAPGCIGVSLAWTESRVLFTLVASDDEIAVLDALQYLGGGPGLHVVSQQQGLEASTESLLRETSWSLFARASLARGAHSILALPLTQHGRVTGTVTFYGSTEGAFEGAHEKLSDLLEAWAPDAIRLAKPSLTLRRTSGTDSRRLRDEGLINRAMATTAAARGVDVVTANELLSDAATRAGISPARLAETLLGLQP